MKAKKQIIFTEDIELKTTGITLLSTDECSANKDIIPPINEWWWLRSRGYYQRDTIYVSDEGSLYDCYVHIDGCVRPALHILNPESSNLKRGDKFELAGYAWTVLSDDLALCDEIVGKTFFRYDYKASDANDFDVSDIKKWLYNWADEHGIEFMMQAFNPE